MENREDATVNRANVPASAPNTGYISTCTGAPTPCETHLITSQNLEGGDDLVCRVCIGGFPGHEIDEGLECHGTGAVGIYYAHDAGKFGITLATKETAG